jgi:hypothetical protein
LVRRLASHLRVTARSIETASDLLRSTAQAELSERFTERDLRAKCASDAGSLEHARALLAHADARTTERVYRRKPERVKPPLIPHFAGLSTAERYSFDSVSHDAYKHLLDLHVMEGVRNTSDSQT